MIRRAAVLTLAAILGSGTAAVSAPQHHPTKHRPPPKHCKHRRKHHRCPKPAPKPTTPTKPSGPLPSRLEVDENDQGQPPRPYSLWPSHNPVASGTVQFNVYNFGQDPHTLAIVNSSGQRRAFVRVPANQPQTAVPVNAKLPPGTYTLKCTLAGHASLGMVATLTVK